MASQVASLKYSFNDRKFCPTDLFKASVDTCTTLKDCQKLQYMKTSVKGDAAKLISYVPLLTANYSTAWKILVYRYQKERSIARSYIHAMFSCPVVKPNDAEVLRFLIEMFEKNLMAMNALGADNWETLLIYLVSEKLDGETRRNWELQTRAKTESKCL